MSNNKNYFDSKFGFKKNPKVEKSKDARLEKRIRKEYEGKDQEKWEHQDKFDASRKKSYGDKPYGEKKSFGDKKFGDKKFGDKKFGDKPYGERKAYGDKPYGEKKSYGDKPFGERKSFGDKKFGDKPYGERKAYGDKPYGEKKSYGDKPSGERKSFGDKKFGDKPYGDKPYGEKKSFGDKKFGEKKGFGRKEDNKEEKPKKFGANIFAGEKKDKEVFYTEEDRVRLFGEEAFKDRVLKELEDEIDNDLEQDKKDKAFKKKQERRTKRESRRDDDEYGMTKYIDDESDYEIAYEAAGGTKWEVEKAIDPNYRKPVSSEDEMPLNKYIAYCGICSRRDAVDIIKSGKVSIDNVVCTEPGRKVSIDTNVTVDGKKVSVQKNIVYVLMNKPKGFITTTDDPKGRRTVMDLVSNFIEERVFPVGRLDRNTTGLLLLTNDGELAQQLAHPKYDIRKIYHVVLDKNLSKADFDKIVAGVELEDGIAPVDHLAYLESKNEIGIEIHSGKNRIVRRIFESCGYVVEKLDRVMYAGLTKKNIPRGKWRMLSKQEVINLKHLGKK